MKVEVSNVSSFQRKLSFVVPADDVRRELDNAYRQVGRQARIRGFRPGKVPRRVLEGRFGPSVKADVMQKLVNDSWVKAMAEQEIEPVGQPSLDETGDLASNSDFQFSILVDVKPEIALETYTGVSVYYPKVEVTDDEVDTMVASRLEEAARLVEVTDRGVEKGDMVMIELLAKDGDDEVAREIGTMIRTEADPYYPGIEDLLVGVKTGKTKKKKGVKFDEDARNEDVAGRELDVELKVISIQANEVPELSDDVAEELGYEGGAEGMKVALRAGLAEGRDGLARNQARANMLERLIELNPFDVPDGMVDNALNMLVEELKMQQAFQTGTDPKNIRFSEAQLQDLRTRAVFASKSSLILEFVSKTETIEVTADDIEAKYQELADSRGQTVEAVKGWFSGDDAENELKDRILEEKTLDWLLEKCELVDEPIATAAAEAAEAPAEEKPAKKKSTKKAEKPEPEAEAAPAGDVDTSVLDQAVGKLKTALATGEYDGMLDALEAAETAGKNRKGALAAIASRR